MINQIAQTESRRTDPIESFFSELKSNVFESLKTCSEALKSQPATGTRVEYNLSLAITISSIMTVVAPMFINHPLTRLVCAIAFATSLLLFLGQRLTIVKSMTKEEVHSFIGMLATTFLFGLAVALVISEVVHISM